MVAKMTSSGDSEQLGERNEDIPSSEVKGDLLGSESTSTDSDETSTEEEPEDDEEEEEGEAEEEEEAGYAGASPTESKEKGAVPERSTEAHEAELLQPCCAKCSALQKQNHEVVTPRKMSRGQFLLSLDGEGTYECSVTGLVFEVTQSVKIRYSILSWSKFGSLLKDGWKFAGPVFDVDCDPFILRSIQFPHSLCLASDEDSGVKFSVLHVKGQRGLIEPSVEHSGSHIKWSVSSLSPVGPIVQTSKPVEHHGVVLVYKEVGQQSSYSFRIYLATNNDSDIKDIQKEVRSSKKRYVKMEKPPRCRVEEERRYRLMSVPEGDITPEDIQFTLAVVKMKGYFEAFFEQDPPFKLSLIEVDSGQPVWTATIREGDCVNNFIEKCKKRTESRKRSSSTSEEELTNKRPRWNDESGGLECDGVKAGGAGEVSDQQLMRIAKCMGREWKQVAIGSLGVSMQEVEKVQSEEEELTMQKFRVLALWRRRQPKGKASPVELQKCLEEEDVPNEVQEALEEMLNNNPAKRA